MLAAVTKNENFLLNTAESLGLLTLRLNTEFSLFFYYILLFSFFIVILSKSAQFGFHIWLLEAMEAPLPASSLIHSATLVCAGVVLFFKINLFSFFNSYLLNALILWAAFTSLALSTSALFNYDIKKILAYSTGSHISIMLISAASSNLSYSFIYLLVHASSKVFLFLLFGYIIDVNNSIRDLRKMGAFFFSSYLLNFALIAIFSLSSLPFFTLGFLKDFFFLLLFKNSIFWDITFTILGLSTLVNYLYMYRLFFKIFFGDKLSFTGTYFKNFFFFYKDFYLSSKNASTGKLLSNTKLVVSFFILFLLFVYILLLESSSLTVLKMDIFFIFSKSYEVFAYELVNSVLLFLTFSNSYFFFLVFFFFTFVRIRRI